MTTPPPPPTPPGWYPDPTGGGSRRYWDGSAWGPPPKPAPKESSLKSWWFGLSGNIQILVVAGVIGAAILLVSLPGGENKDKQCAAPSKSSQSHSTSSEFNAPGTIGEEVRDGKLAFVVTAIDACQGDPVAVHMKVTNTSTESLQFYPSSQELLRNPSHATGEVPKGGFACESCDGKGEKLFINPGDSIDTVVSFDVRNEEPAIEAIELHDSPLSFGVKVYP